MVEDINKIANQMMEQKITKQVTINAGASDKVSIPIPKYRKVLLKGYGYTWYTKNTYTLSTGNKQFKPRSDQEGSPSIPMIYGNPFPCRSGGNLELYITNGDSSSRTYDVVFYILTEEYLDETSTGGELILVTGSASAVTSGKVSIYDSSGVTPVDVTTREDGKKALVVDTEITFTGGVTIDNVKVFSTNGLSTGLVYGKSEADGTLINKEAYNYANLTHTAVTIGNTSTSVLTSNATRKYLLLQNISDEDISISFTGSAVANTGIVIKANGGVYELPGKFMTDQAITGICASGSKTLLVTYA
jgi:hypothetical protein